MVFVPLQREIQLSFVAWLRLFTTKGIDCLLGNNWDITEGGPVLSELKQHKDRCESEILWKHLKPVAIQPQT